jgi:plasmid stability protein
MNMTLKQIKPAVHRKLKKQAERHGRSINMEALKLIEEGLEPDLNKIFADIRKINARQLRPVTTEEIRAAIVEGRE